ncbi:hypothetical protein I4U23_026966 [Adineta vaga]|nr:hypothetical protein I4U23_026966 [Adineta vaga]
MAFTKRLLIHFGELQKNPAPLCYAEPKDSNTDISNWTGYIDGPADTPYAGGRFHLTIYFSNEFPFKPPEVRFITPVYHPNIGTDGEICLDILHSQWSPALTIRGLLISLCSLLTDPNSEHGLNRDALKLYGSNKDKYNVTAREWTRRYAMKSDDSD